MIPTMHATSRIGSPRGAGVSVDPKFGTLKIAMERPSAAPESAACGALHRRIRRRFFSQERARSSRCYPLHAWQFIRARRGGKIFFDALEPGRAPRAATSPDRARQYAARVM